ncbi:MAG TPA: hypothetical protein VKT31_05460 [Solirubrobacteraceae bacterium]|nr:hypothetical protein [Solirubrobacteraceae bacterium]
MSESRLEARPIAGQATVDLPPAAEPARWSLRRPLRERTWWIVAALLVVGCAGIVVWAKTRPSYDAYGWLVWGYQTLHGHLDLGGAPSWKPLPFLFTVPYALFGHYQMWLWMITAATVSFAGAIFAGRITFRLLDGEDPVRRGPALVAAVFAGLAVLGLEDYMHYILSAQSDPMLVTFVLAAIDMFLIGRYRWTLVLGVLAALGRPEVWPFLGLFGLWAWLKVPRMRWMLIAGAALIAFMWFGIPWITNGRPNISGQLAKLSPRALRSNRVFGTIGRFTELEYLPVWIAALCAVAVAAVRRQFAVLALAAGVVVWVIIEIAFAFHGWPALPRYMFEVAGVSAVLAGVAVGWALIELPRIRVGLPRWTGVPVVAILLLALVPGAVARLRNERKDLRHERGRTHEIALLQTTTDVLGGSRHIRNCGQPVTDVGYVSALAWLYHTNVGSVGGLQQAIEKIELRRPIPKVLFSPLVHGGWAVVPWHTRPSQVARCQALHAEYVLTPGHPGGVLIRH